MNSVPYTSSNMREPSQQMPTRTPRKARICGLVCVCVCMCVCVSVKFSGGTIYKCAYK